MEISQKKLKKPTLFSKHKIWFLLGFSTIGVIGIAFLSFATGYWLRPRLIGIFYNEGFYGERVTKDDLIRFVKDGTKNSVTSYFSAPEVKKLTLNVKYKSLHKLYEKRNEALRAGMLKAEDEDFVPAKINFQGENIPVEIRLKGDNLDHLESDRWSFRVKVEGKGQFFGLRRFSLQHPKTRLYQREIIFHEHMRAEGVIAPRTFLVDVTINGKNVGLMQIEEHFSKELLESQRRRESVILKFGENRHWDNLMWIYGLETMGHAPVEAFGTGQILKNETLKQSYDNGAKLLLAFQHNTLPISEIFDLKILARYLAVLEVWNGIHAMSWNNIRFYYNPISGLLEPIAFDAQIRDEAETTMLLNSMSLLPHPIGHRFLQDPQFVKIFVPELQRIAKGFRDGSIESMASKVENNILPILWRDFPFLQKWDLQFWRNRALQLEKITLENYNTERRTEPLYRNLVIPHVVLKGKTFDLSITNLIAKRQHLDRIYVKNRANKKETEISLKGIPRLIPSADETGEAQTLKIPGFSTPDLLTDSDLFVVTKPIDLEKTFTTKAEFYWEPAKTPILKSHSVPFLKGLPFLKWNQKEQEFSIPPGTWTISDTLVFPDGIGLKISPGVTLKFGETANLILKGRLLANGTNTSPIKLTAQGKSWRGLAVLGAQGWSELHYVTIEKLSGLSWNTWKSTGCNLFYESNLRIRNTKIEHCHSEDALNVVRSEFDFDRFAISHSISDAFDSDFSKGTITRSQFVDIGGDGVDVSGTEITVTQSQFQTIHDKAISVGEASRLTAENVSISDVGTGVASKDQSVATIKTISLKDIKYFGLMAYMKKPEYGSGSITVQDVQSTMGDHLALAQTGSDITIDGKLQKTQDVDMDQIYKKGFMKK